MGITSPKLESTELKSNAYWMHLQRRTKVLAFVRRLIGTPVSSSTVIVNGKMTTSVL